MIDVRPVILERGGIRLEPLTDDHHDALEAAAADGRLWELWFTAVPAPGGMRAYVADCAAGPAGRPHAPLGRARSGERRHHRLDALSRHRRRQSIAWRSATRWYAQSRQRTHVNTTCKLLLLAHAFDTLGCKVVGLRTDNFNFRSQRAIEGLGAKKDGVIRHHAARRDGSVRDSVMYSILAAEWPDVRRHLELRLARHAGSSGLDS